MSVMGFASENSDGGGSQFIMVVGILERGIRFSKSRINFYKV